MSMFNRPIDRRDSFAAGILMATAGLGFIATIPVASRQSQQIGSDHDLDRLKTSSQLLADIDRNSSVTLARPGVPYADPFGMLHTRTLGQHLDDLRSVHESIYAALKNRDLAPLHPELLGVGELIRRVRKSWNTALLAIDAGLPDDQAEASVAGGQDELRRSLDSLQIVLGKLCPAAECLRLVAVMQKGARVFHRLRGGSGIDESHKRVAAHFEWDPLRTKYLTAALGAADLSANRESIAAAAKILETATSSKVGVSDAQQESALKHIERARSAALKALSELTPSLDTSKSETPAWIRTLATIERAARSS